MDAKTRERMVKCLELTRSSSDGEALSAIRMANKMREKLNVSWDQLLSTGGASSSHRRPETGSYNYYDTDPFTQGMYQAQAEQQRKRHEDAARAARYAANRARARTKEQAEYQRQYANMKARHKEKAEPHEDFDYQKPQGWETFKW